MYNSYNSDLFKQFKAELSMKSFRQIHGWVNPRVGLGRKLNLKIVVQTLQKFTALHTNIIHNVIVSSID